MATVKLKLDKRAKKQDGTYPVKIYVSHKGDFFISTDISVPQDEWIGTEETPTTNKRYNSILTAMLGQTRSTIGELRISRRLFTMTKNDLKSTILAWQAGNVDYDHLDKVQKPLLVGKAFEAFAESANTQGTKSIYRQTLTKLGKYYDLETLEFGNITASWLREFESRMKEEKIKTNSISINLRNLRAVYNRAIDDELIDMAGYPFRKFKIKSEPTMKRSLTVEQLRTLRDYPCEPHQERYRDLFMLIFYLVGINIGDLLNLKKINGDRLEFRRAKTGRLYSIRVEPEALAIIERYSGEDHLLDVNDNYSNYKDFLHRMNKNLKQIGEVKRVGLGGKKEREPILPMLSTYWARHTWATIAADLDIPDETISLALGHAGANSTTNIYINRNQRKVDEANRRVINHVNQLCKQIEPQV